MVTRYYKGDRRVRKGTRRSTKRDHLSRIEVSARSGSGNTHNRRLGLKADASSSLGGLMDRRHFLATLAGSVALGDWRLAFCQERPRRSWQALNQLLAEYVGAKKLAGAAVAVSDGDAAPTYLKAGRIAFDTETAFDEHSVCRIYSMTKMVTGLSTMLLVQAGKLRLDQAAAEIIPEMRKLRVALDLGKGLESRPAKHTMTIRHLLTHTSGLAYWIPTQGTDALSAAYRARGITPGNYGAGLKRPGHGPQAVGLDDMVKRLAELPLAAEPGAVWRYSVGIDVMGLVIQRVSGKPLDVFAHEHFFEPLGMASTGFQVPPTAASLLSTNYSVTPDGLVPLDPRQASVFLI